MHVSILKWFFICSWRGHVPEGKTEMTWCKRCGNGIQLVDGKYCVYGFLG